MEMELVKTNKDYSKCQGSDYFPKNKVKEDLKDDTRRKGIFNCTIT